MGTSLDIAGVRASTRNENFCQSVDKGFFKQLVDCLLEGQCDADEKQQVLASIANILLINRNLHISYFTPELSRLLLPYLNTYLCDLIPSSSYYDSRDSTSSSSTTSVSSNAPSPRPGISSQQVSADSFESVSTKTPPQVMSKPIVDISSQTVTMESRFPLLIAPYRLIFLILYDDPQFSSSMLDQTFKCLSRGVDYCLNDTFNPQQPKIAGGDVSTKLPTDSNFNYLIQADDENNDHYTMETHIYTNVYPQNRDHVLALIEILKGLYSFYHKNEKYIEKGKSQLPFLIRSVVSVGSAVSKLDKNQHLLIKNLLNVITIIITNIGNVEYFRLPIYQQFAKTLMSVLHHRLMIYLNTEEGDLNDISSLFILITYLSREFRRHTCQSARDEFINSILPTSVEKIPPIYDECLRIISRPSGSFDCTKSLKEEMTLSHLKSLIIECFFELSWKPDNTQQFKLFFEYVGYLNSRSYLTNNHANIPATINVNEYILPKYYNKPTETPSEDTLSSAVDISQSFRNILASHKNTPQASIQMTQEEKEQEAEKLFVIFERMEKTGVFQDFANPIKEWQQSGKFESLPDDNDE